ncbi:vacuolar amino acid transporter 1-like [Phalaenopsis equestris]|uniref:vacuolar amino acid transporter 1-like n=1 Tax=Phalaenopsis equestris TaxID=78828 RepID=UPI0009E38B04|nr:vacuolar amino acid transporter 1-like [Phalaenopsis equestris]
MASPADEENGLSSSMRAPLLQTHGRLPGHEGEATFARTCFNVTNALSGIGVLSVPYALSEGGWISLALFFLVALVCFYTGLLLQRCMDADPHIRSYLDVGEFAFGYNGRIIVAIFMYIELYLVAVSFLILEGDNLDNLFPNLEFQLLSLTIKQKQFFLLVSALIILPTTWLRNLGGLAYISAGGVVASVILMCSLLWIGVTETGFQMKGRVLNLGGLPTALGLFFVCFTSHAMFPTIQASMREKTRFSKVLVISFALCIFNYGAMAVLGYLMYGENLKSQVTLNLPPGKISSKIAIYTTLINPLAKYALTITPISFSVEEWLAFHLKRSHGTLVRTLLLLSTVLVASSIPFFGYLMAFIGSFLSIMVSVLFPCVFYMKIYRVSFQRNGFEMVVIVGVMVTGVLISVVGTYSSIAQIISSL